MDRDAAPKDGYLKVNLEGEAGRVDVNLPQPIPDINITGISTARPPPSPQQPPPTPAPQPAPPPAPATERRESPRRARSPSVRASSASDGMSARGFGIDDLVNPRKRRSPAPDRDDGRSGGHKGRRERERSRSVSSRSYASGRSSHHASRGKATRDAQKPSPGFATLKEEKLHILLALRRLKEEGVRGITDFDQDGDIEEMRIELRAFEDDETVRTGIQSCRTALVTFSTGLEVANTKYNPFDLDMRGFSESVFERIERYDGVFERLVRKWSKRASSMSPEMMLLMMFVGNAAAFCFTKSMMTPETASRVVADNPDVIKEMIDRRVKEEMARAKEEEARAREKDSFRFFDPPRPTRGSSPPPPAQKAEIGVPAAGKERRKRGPAPRGEPPRRRRDDASTSASSESDGSEWSRGGNKRRRYDSEPSVSSMDTVEESIATTGPRPTTVTAKATVKKVPIGKAGGGAKRKVVEIEI